MERETQYKLLPRALLPWFRENARDLPWRRDKEPYHVWLSEIMPQQTRVEAVRGYYLRFLQALPTLADLADCDEGALLKLWEGLGYYSRARNLQKAARVIVSAHGGRFPEDFEAIRALPGVGPYTAGAVASICFEQKRAAVDGNVLRVLSRITEDFSPVDLPEVKKDFTARLRRNSSWTALRRAPVPFPWMIVTVSRWPMTAVERKFSTTLSASSVSSPRMSSSRGAAAAMGRPGPRLTVTCFFRAARSSSSMRRTSPLRAFIFRAPALSCKVPSFPTDTTSAACFTPGISTRSPAWMGREGLGMGACRSS